MTDTTPTPADRPADQLRAAAEKLREEAARAHRASPGPWAVTDEHVVRCADRMIVADRSDTDHPAERADLPYIALMHPGVGLAVAAWLDVAADHARQGFMCCDDGPDRCSEVVTPALAVARQLLGTNAAEGARCICGETACESENCDCDTRTCSVDHAAEETDEEREQREDVEATARAHAAGDHEHCGPTCEAEFPTDHLRNFVIAKGYPGTAGALDELMRRAAAPPAPADRAAVLRWVAATLDGRAAVLKDLSSSDYGEESFAARELTEQADRLRALVDEAEYVATPCSVGACEPGGEPCTTHERLMAHAEGDHELCDHPAADAAAGVQPPTEGEGALRVRISELAGSWRLGADEGDLGPGWASAAAALLAVVDNPHITHTEVGLDHPATTGRAPAAPAAPEEAR